HFPQGRPDWAAQFTNDVAAWETMKLRLLNGAHSSLAYLGYLSGRETVAEAMVDEAMARFVRRLMDEEVTPVLRVPAGADVPAYKDALITRFRNPALKHRTWQIAMDGSQKLPQRLLGTVRDRLAAGASVTLLAHGVAAWMRYVSGMDEKGQPIDVRDPMAAELKRRAGEGTLLDVQAIFGTDLPANETFRAAVNAAFQSLTTKGAAATLRELV
ncbi:MAG: mannitol dehydrogenase family protein, partial [Aestuariivirgaceae bacterium]|nr:mannitol dehydrogenase family protein [Aestuariivirgaceae bacterium]